MYLLKIILQFLFIILDSANVLLLEHGKKMDQVHSGLALKR